MTSPPAQHILQLRLCWAIAFTAPLVVLAIASTTGHLPIALQGSANVWLHFVLAIPVLIWCATDLWRDGWRALRAGRPDGDTLTLLAVAVAFAAGACLVLLPALLPIATKDTGSSGLHFVSAAIIATLALLARWLESRAWARAGSMPTEFPNDAPMQQLAERTSVWLTWSVMVVAILAATAWFVLGPEPALQTAIVVAVSTLVIASPRAFSFATPLALRVAADRGAQSGVLFQGARALEQLETIDTVVLGKSGRLTRGQPEIVTVLPVDGVSATELLRFAASLEQASEHPLGQEITRLALEHGLRLGRCLEFEVHPGAGVAGVVQLQTGLVGNEWLLRAHGIDPGSLLTEATPLREQGQTVVFVAVGDQAIGLISFADPLRAETWEAVKALKGLGLRIALMSCDHPATVAAIAAESGIDEVHGGIDPYDPPGIMARMRAEGRRVAMVGDPVIDAAGFAAADMRIAIGAGPASPPGSVDVALADDDLHGLVRAFQLSERAMANARRSLWFACGYNALAVALAAGLWFAVFERFIPPALAAVAMLLSLTGVMAHALRLRRVTFG